MPKAAFVLTVPWEVRLGCGLPNPPHGFQRKTQPNFCFKTFLGITLIPLLNYCSQIAGGAKLLGAQGTLQLGDLGC